MLQLTDDQRQQWQTNGYLHLEQVFDARQVELFCNEFDRIRHLPGYEPDRNPELPIGHYKWLEHAENLDSGGFRDRRDLLPYHQAFIDLVDRAPVFNYIVALMGGS